MDIAAERPSADAQPGTDNAPPVMRVRPNPSCPVCGSDGPVAYGDLPDRLFGIPGRWDVRRCQDDACGTLWLDPVPLPEDVHLAYRVYATHATDVLSRDNRGRLARAYADAKRAHVSCRFDYPYEGRKIRRRLLTLALRAWPGRAACAESEALHLPARPGGKLLDVGCGDGRSVEWLRSLGWDAEGIDFDRAAVATATARGIPVRQGDLRSLDVGQPTFDALTLSHVIEHVHDPRSLLAECGWMLRSGGRIVVVTPNARSFLAQRYAHDWIGLDPPRHLQVFTLGVLTRLVREAGFAVERSFTTARGANSAVVAANAFRRGRRNHLLTPATLTERVPAELMQQVECLRLKFDPEAGEEVVVVGRQP